MTGGEGRRGEAAIGKRWRLGFGEDDSGSWPRSRSGLWDQCPLEGQSPILRLGIRPQVWPSRGRTSFRGLSPSSISEVRASQSSLAPPTLEFRLMLSKSRWRPSGKVTQVRPTRAAPTLVLPHLALGTHQSWRWSWLCWRRDRCRGARARWRHCCLPGPCWWLHQQCGGRSRAAEPPVG